MSQFICTAGGQGSLGILDELVGLLIVPRQLDLTGTVTVTVTVTIMAMIMVTGAIRVVVTDSLTAAVRITVRPALGFLRGNHLVLQLASLASVLPAERWGRVWVRGRFGLVQILSIRVRGRGAFRVRVRVRARYRLFL